MLKSVKFMDKTLQIFLQKKRPKILIFYTSLSKPRRIENIKKFELCVLSINLTLFDIETQN
jgi:hypothetical protein